MDNLNRKIKPTPKGEIIFNAPEIKTFSLKNSLQVYFVKKTTLPIIQINIFIPAGSICNFGGKHGLSTLTSMLIDEGAGNFTGLEISDEFEKLGSIFSINSNKEYTTLSLLTLKENFEKSIIILSMIIQSPNFNEPDFERELSRLKNQILQLNDDPSFVASKEIQKLILSKTPYEYPSTGVIDTLNDLSNEHVREFYKKNYFADDSVIVITGDIEDDIAFSLLNKHFNTWDSNLKSIQNQITITPTRKKLLLINKEGAAQSEIRIGHFSKGRSSEDFYSRSLLNSILGGQFSSRINLNLREDKGYTYGAHSSYSYNKVGSTFIISTSVQSENTMNSIEEILKELDLIKENIKENELNFSKSYLTRRYPSLFETYSQIATNVSLLPIYNLNTDYFNNYIANINRVTLNDVKVSAKESILVDNLVIVVVGNREMLEKELEQLANKKGFKFIV